MIHMSELDFLPSLRCSGLLLVTESGPERSTNTRKMVKTVRAIRPTMDTAVMSSGFSLLTRMEI